MVVNSWFQRQIGALLASAGGLFGAFVNGGAGLGGTVVQGTSRTTAVTLNKLSGSITLFSVAGSAAVRAFTVNNSLVNKGDVIIPVQQSGADKYFLSVTNVQDGSFEISSYTTGGTTVEQPVFNFVVLKAAQS